MQIIASLANSQSIPITISPEQTVGALKSEISLGYSLPAADFALTCRGQIMNDELTLQESNLSQLSVVNVALPLLGGKRKKKKNYKTPKRVKHVKKKVKQHILKFYKIETDGTVTRLRKKCSSDTCHLDTFMAKHADRHSCGKCGLSIPLEKS